MRKTLFSIGCVLFFWGLLFSIIVFIGLINTHLTEPDFNYEKINYPFLSINLVLFLAGTYLVSNNKPEEKD